MQVQQQPHVATGDGQLEVEVQLQRIGAQVNLPPAPRVLVDHRALEVILQYAPYSGEERGPTGVVRYEV